LLVHNIIYWGIPSLVLVANTVLFLILALSKKDTHVITFMLFMGAMASWPAASLFMKLQLPPGVLIWNRVMVSAMLMIPYFAYIFVSKFTGLNKRTSIIVISIVTLVLQVFNGLGLIIESASMVLVDVNGISRLELDYTIGPMAGVMFAIIFIMLALSLRMMRKAIKTGNKSSTRLRPVIFGFVVLFTGMIFNLVPVIGKYPVDLAFGLITSLIMFYAVYKTRVLELKFVITRAVIFTALLTLLVTITVYIVKQITVFFGNTFVGLGTQSQTLISTLISILMFLPLFNIVQQLVQNYFYKVEQHHNNLIKQFTLKVSNNLNLEIISEELLKVIKEITEHDRAYLFLENSETQHFEFSGSIKKLDKLTFTMLKTHPFVHWFKRNDDIIYEKYIDSHAFFKTMWDNEKHDLLIMRFEAAIPLKYNGQLIGMLLIGSKDSSSRLIESVLNQVSTLCATAAITISNAKLYEKTKREAIMDSLTNVFNRRHFMDKLQEYSKNLKNQSVSLIMLNIDMFSLYNDLYGHIDGDRALEKFANTIKTICGSQGQIFRYGEDTLAIILPYSDTKMAYEMAEKIRLRMSTLSMARDVTTQRFVTISAGLCVAPTLANDGNDLLHKASLALRSAKMNGKNQSVVYHDEILEQQIKGSEEMNMATIYALTAAIDAKDHFTFGHSQRVARYACAIAEELGKSKEEVELIRQASLLHDIGKIGIPEHILTKTTSLTDEEFETMKRHVEMSITIIKYLPAFSHVIPAVMGHHERWDGFGYPRKVAGENNPFPARCIAIADAFDAITSDRHYKSFLDVEHALEEIERNAGTQFDPTLAFVFTRVIRSGRVIIEPSRNNSLGTNKESPSMKA
jgi:diguanylate cyclase (GGDEF)-like protein/putative nucleotidyltransferase with HDIG domain